MDRAKAYFKGKKITILGLGLLGKGVGDAVFLAQCGANITVTDLKSKKELAPSVALLRPYKNVRLVLGTHELSDFETCDMVIKAQGVRLDSPYIAHARAHNIPIRMDDELFYEFAPKITLIGVTGTRGKTTTATLIYSILKKAGKSVHLAGNIRGVATLALLPKIKAGDFVVMELSSWQLQGFAERKISPHISVFTNFMPDHMNYYDNDLKQYFADKAAIFTYQTEKDILITSKDIARKIPKKYKGKLVVVGAEQLPASWNNPLPGEHNHANSAQAIAVAQACKIPMADIKKAVESFTAVSGRLQYMKAINGVKIYNDNSSSTPEATSVALHSFPDAKNILIMGGTDKDLAFDQLIKDISQYCAHVVLLPGSGTDRMLASSMTTQGANKSNMTTQNITVPFEQAKNITDAVKKALHVAKKGDRILFSPGFTSFGMFKNVYDRGDQFIAVIKKLSVKKTSKKKS